MLRHAVLEDVPDVYAVFQTYPHIFPHMRFDRTQRLVAAGQCIWQDGVVITYQTYQKTVRLGDYVAPRGSISLHQIVKSAAAVVGAAARIFTIFLDEYVPTRLVLSVRADNTSAWQFYERHGLQRVGGVCWQQQGHPLPGYVYEWIRAVDNPLF
jgi:hypothetical protein